MQSGARDPRRARAPGSRDPKQTSCGHWPLTKPKGRETSGGEIRNKCISVRPTLRRQWTSVSKAVSKMLKIPLVSARKIQGKVGWVTSR